MAQYINYQLVVNLLLHYNLPEKIDSLPQQEKKGLEEKILSNYKKYVQEEVKAGRWDEKYGPELVWGKNDFKEHVGRHNGDVAGAGIDYDVPIDTPVVSSAMGKVFKVKYS